MWQAADRTGCGWERMLGCSDVNSRKGHPFVLQACGLSTLIVQLYTWGADKSLARPTSRCILFHGENISFDASLVIYTNSTNIPPIMIINRLYESKSSVAVACFLPGRAKDLSAPL
jgi:hypothetical protein